MSHRYKVLRIISTLNPKYGGPSNTIIDSSKLLYKTGFKVDVRTYTEQPNNHYGFDEYETILVCTKA